MILKYWGTAYEKGLTITIDLYKTTGDVVHTGFATTETVANSSAIYKTANIFTVIPVLPAGIYVMRVVDASGNFLSHDEIIFNGVKEITLLDLKFMTDKELMQLRDALGIDGNKIVAKGGQLQKKSEAPYNNIIDTRDII